MNDNVNDSPARHVTQRYAVAKLDVIDLLTVDPAAAGAAACSYGQPAESLSAVALEEGVICVCHSNGPQQPIGDLEALGQQCIDSSWRWALVGGAAGCWDGARWG
jgi:hypothetical protein